MPLAWCPAYLELGHAGETIGGLPLKIISNIKERLDFCIDQNAFVFLM